MTKPPLDPEFEEFAKARNIVESDGNAFHAKVARYFRELGWTVLISPYYVDNATGQAREIDLLCEREFTYELHERGGYGIYRVQLFVECKYVAGPVVFWFDEQDRSRALDWLDAHTPFTRGRRRAHRQHRYISEGTHVAKLFRSADNHDPIYKGLAQSLGALIQRRDAPPLFQGDR